jgi:hypothetical protein
MLKMLAICRQIANDLDCTIPDLVVEDLPKYIQGYYNPTSKRLVISYDVFNGDIPSLIAVLAHEMRHHWQHQVGKLKVDDTIKTRSWEGEEYTQTSFGVTYCKTTNSSVRYVDLPWEIDANNYAAEYCTRLANKEKKVC